MFADGTDDNTVQLVVTVVKDLLMIRAGFLGKKLYVGIQKELFAYIYVDPQAYGKLSRQKPQSRYIGQIPR